MKNSGCIHHHHHVFKQKVCEEKYHDGKQAEKIHSTIIIRSVHDTPPYVLVGWVKNQSLFLFVVTVHTVWWYGGTTSRYVPSPPVPAVPYNQQYHTVFIHTYYVQYSPVVVPGTYYHHTLVGTYQQ